MKRKLLIQGILAASVLAGAQIQAADIRINGFASIGGGKTFSEGTDNSSNASSEGEVEYSADLPSQGNYNSNFDFKADSIYGVQFSSDLGDGLSATGQITGAGGEDFQATIAWAYISYDINDSWSVQAGRQRIPLFFYSDFLDVGYAYHWMRPPSDINLPVDSFDGIKLNWQGSLGDWDARSSVYYGTNETDSEAIGELGFDNMIGAVFYASNDWLQLRASHLVGDIWIDNLSANSLDATQDQIAYQYVIEGGLPFADGDANPLNDATGLAGIIMDKFSRDPDFREGQGEENANGAVFSSIAAHATFGNAFVVAEYTIYEFDDPVISEGWTEVEGYYMSAGYRIGSLTPHITYSVNERELDNYFNPVTYANASLDPLTDAAIDGTEKTESITVGLRWDFHPAAAIKFEYQTSADKSDQEIIDVKGDAREVDTFSAGIDIIF